MSQIQKLIHRIKSRPKDFKWEEVCRLLRHFGYEEFYGNGSRRKFMHEKYGLIILHEPHPSKILKMYQIDQVIEILNEGNLL